MVIDNKYMVGSIGWLPERCTHGVDLYFLPQWDTRVSKYAVVIHWANFTLAWCGWRRWPYVSWHRDERYRNGK